MAEFFFKVVEVGFGVFVISLEFGEFHQVFEVFFAFAIVGKSVFDDAFLEIFVVGIADLESGWVLGCGVFGDVVGFVFEHRFGGVYCHAVTVAVGEIDGDVRHGVGPHFHVGHDASSVAHNSAVCGVEYFCERVGHVLGVSAACVFVVDGLYAPSAGDEIFSGGYFHASVVGHVHG